VKMVALLFWARPWGVLHEVVGGAERFVGDIWNKWNAAQLPLRHRNGRRQAR